MCRSLFGIMLLLATGCLFGCWEVPLDYWPDSPTDMATAPDVAEPDLSPTQTVTKPITANQPGEWKLGADTSSSAGYYSNRLPPFSTSYPTAGAVCLNTGTAYQPVAAFGTTAYNGLRVSELTRISTNFACLNGFTCTSTKIQIAVFPPSADTATVASTWPDRYDIWEITLPMPSVEQLAPDRWYESAVNSKTLARCVRGTSKIDNTQYCEPRKTYQLSALMQGNPDAQVLPMPCSKIPFPLLGGTDTCSTQPGTMLNAAAPGIVFAVSQTAKAAVCLNNMSVDYAGTRTTTILLNR